VVAAVVAKANLRNRNHSAPLLNAKQPSDQ